MFTPYPWRAMAAPFAKMLCASHEICNLYSSCVRLCCLMVYHGIRDGPWGNKPLPPLMAHLHHYIHSILQLPSRLLIPSNLHHDCHGKFVDSVKILAGIHRSHVCPSRPSRFVHDGHQEHGVNAPSVGQGDLIMKGNNYNIFRDQ